MATLKDFKTLKKNSKQDKKNIRGFIKSNYINL